MMCLMPLGPTLASAQDVTATDFVRAQVDATLEIVNRPVTRGTDAFAQRQNDLRAAVRSFLDFEELCRRALGDHWDARSPEEQVEFVGLMTTLVETNYTVKLGDRTANSSYEVSYTGEDLIRQYARVTGTVTSGDETTAVEVLMIQREPSWVAYDVVADDVSVLETYSESFDEIIRDEGWDALVQRIRDRIAELETELEGQRAAE